MDLLPEPIDGQINLVNTPSSRSRLHGLTTLDLGAILVVVAIGILFADLWLGHSLFYGDFSALFLPQRDFIAQSWARGDVPGWASRLGMGIPLVGNPILGTFYPLYLPLGFLPTPWGLNALLVLHFMLAFVGMRRLCLRITGDAWAGNLAGVTFALSGTLVASSTYVYLLVSWTWVPFFLATCVGISARPRGRVAWGSLYFALILLAGAPTAAAAAVLFGIIIARNSQPTLDPQTSSAQPTSAPPGSARTSALRPLGWIVGVGVLLACVQWVPTLALLGNTERAGGVQAHALLSWSLHPARLLAFLNPFPWGSWGPEFTFIGSALSEGTLSDGNFFYYAIHVGVAPLMLLPVALGRGPHARLARVLFAATMATVIMAMGCHIPPIGWLWVHTPGLSFLRYPERIMMAATLLLGILAGVGAANLRQQPQARRWGVAAMGAGLAAVSLYTVIADATIRTWILARLPADMPSVTEDLRALQRQGAWLAMTVVVVMIAGLRWLPRWPAFRFVILLSVIIEMGLAARQITWTAHADLLHTGKQTADLLRQQVPGRTPFVVIDDQRTKTFSYHRDLVGLQRNMATHMLRMRRNFPFHEGLRQALAETPALPANPVDPAIWALTNPAVAADLLGVSHFIVGERAPTSIVQAVSRGELAMRGRLPALGIRILTPTQPDRPPAWCTTRIATDETLALRMLSKDAATSVSDVPANWPLPPDEKARAFIPCTRNIRQEDGDLSADLDLNEPALLVIQERHAPGWHALVDGKPVPVVRAHGSLVAAWVPAGAKHIRLHFQTPGLTLGAILSLLGAVLLIAGPRLAQHTPPNPPRRAPAGSAD